MAEIQRNIDKQGKRSTISQHLHAKSNKEKIIAWRSNLDGILQVFNVRPVARATAVANPLLKALAIDTDAAVPTIGHDITNAHTTVPGTQNDVVNTIPIVPDGHSNTSKIPEDARGRSQLVSTIRTLPVIESKFIPA